MVTRLARVAAEPSASRSDYSSSARAFGATALGTPAAQNSRFVFKLRQESLAEEEAMKS